MKPPAETMPSIDSPVRQLTTFIGKYDPSIGRIVRGARSRLRTLMPRAAVELVYDNYNALAIGFGPTERASDAVVSLAVYPRWVNLYFLRGATLPDPAQLLQGRGNQGRYIKLEAASDIDKPARVPMPKDGRGYMVIKSVSDH